MDCPVCKIPMIVLELDQVETDYCPQWKSDAGEY
jgi:Zn-finger nucleic acid-binding protein